MKKFLKALAVFACAVALVAGSVAATFAYLTAQTETITNTFTVGEVSITLTDTSSDQYLKDGQYKLIPGHTYEKKSTITVNDGSEDCYVFFKLVNGLGADAAFVVNSTYWAAVDGEENVYAYKEIANANDTCVADTPFTLASGAEVEDLGEAKISVTAYAVQADGFATADAAWAASGFATP